MLFFFNDTATTEIYTLSLHDALPIFALPAPARVEVESLGRPGVVPQEGRAHLPAHFEVSRAEDRKSTRLNSSHGYISYAVFCLKKKSEPMAPQNPDNSKTHQRNKRSH